ncbi:unnamed protein product [Prorocentrum cordatum]|uniref:Uncharacterized protein n=1 Tax=Prorocentrum cordatum TaxID=2364126 RepID=A0ABN9PQE3_9DINO|nr:unnamed protein product [Polarella glacialis]
MLGACDADWGSRVPDARTSVVGQEIARKRFRAALEQYEDHVYEMTQPIIHEWAQQRQDEGASSGSSNASGPSIIDLLPAHWRTWQRPRQRAGSLELPEF